MGKTSILDSQKHVQNWIKNWSKNAIFAIFEKLFSSSCKNRHEKASACKNNQNFRKLQKISNLLVVFIFFVAQKTKKCEGGSGGGAK